MARGYVNVCVTCCSVHFCLQVCVSQGLWEGRVHLSLLAHSKDWIMPQLCNVLALRAKEPVWRPTLRAHRVEIAGV